MIIIIVCSIMRSLGEGALYWAWPYIGTRLEIQFLHKPRAHHCSGPAFYTSFRDPGGKTVAGYK